MTTIGSVPILPAPHIDALGHPIAEGDYVVYGVSSNHAVSLRIGRVFKLYHDDRAYGPTYPAKVSMITAERHWSGSWDLQKRGSPVSVYIGSTLVVPSIQIPETVRLLVDPVYEQRILMPEKTRKVRP